MNDPGRMKRSDRCGLSLISRIFSGWAVLFLLALTISGCEAPEEPVADAGPADSSDRLETVAQLETAPGNLTVTADGRIIVSLHQHFSPEMRVGEVIGGTGIQPFPNAAWNDPARPDAQRLDSVLGVQADTEGIVWLLDNGMRSGTTAKLVGWDTGDDELHQVILLPPPATLPNSFLNDLAVDRDSDTIYIADPTRGDQPAIIVVDLGTGTARRVLEAHPSVAPEDIDLVIDQVPAVIRRPDGSTFRPRVGINPIALDADNRWLYYGPMHGTAMYRIRTADLINPDLNNDDLAGRVERFGNKPISDGSSVNHAGEIYISDIGNNAIGKINRNGSYVQLFQDDDLMNWPDAFSFGPEGWCYVVINQLHRGPVLNAAKNEARPPFRIVRFRDEAGGVTGR